MDEQEKLIPYSQTVGKDTGDAEVEGDERIADLRKAHGQSADPEPEQEKDYKNL